MYGITDMETKVCHGVSRTRGYGSIWDGLGFFNPIFSPVTAAVCPSPSLRMPTRSSSMGNLRENQLDEYEGMDCAICARIEYVCSI